MPLAAVNTTSGSTRGALSFAPSSAVGCVAIIFACFPAIGSELQSLPTILATVSSCIAESEASAAPSISSAQSDGPRGLCQAHGRG